MDELLIVRIVDEGDAAEDEMPELLSETDVELVATWKPVVDELVAKDEVLEDCSTEEFRPRAK